MLTIRKPFDVWCSTEVLSNAFDVSGLARVLYVVDALAVRRPGHHDALARPRCAVLDTRPAVSAIVSRRQVQPSKKKSKVSKRLNGKTLFAKEPGLCGRSHGRWFAPGDAHDAKHGYFGKRGARHENPVGRGIQIRGSNLQAVF